jgi:hypothetical protein
MTTKKERKLEKELKDLQEAYDIAIEEINDLRGKLYDKNK